MNAPQAVGVDTRAAIRTQALAKRYGEAHAVEGLDLEIASGEFFGLLGPNGAGKTTAVHMLATLIRPTAGAATVAGFDVLREPVRVRGAIGLVFQESALDRALSVAENLRFAGLLHNLRPRVIAERERELLELFGLADKRAHPVATLSGGMRRALDIVRGVLHEPRVLFLDEPTTGLDLPNRRRIWRFIERLRARTGMTVFLTTHYLEEADGCDRVAFIRKGRLVQSGPPRLLVERLGRHIVEVEGPDLEGLIGALEPRLGPCLRDGDVAYFRSPEEDISAVGRLQAELGAKVSAWRIRRPNLSDVFLWIADGKALA
jgi:ABC-2 type transport system ATP-binding protein